MFLQAGRIYLLCFICCISGNPLTDLGLSTCDKISVVQSTRSRVPSVCEESDCLRYQFQHLAEARPPGWNKQTNISITYLHLHHLHLSDLHLPGGGVREPPGGGAGDHEEALPGEEEVSGDDGHLSGMARHSYS